MNVKFIPIIGTISAGKSTFLRAFLGTDVLETGQTTTTKFVCLIKDSPLLSFYHVILKNENGVVIEKEGDETKSEEEIKKRISDINNKLSESENGGNQNEIFYMLEMPIKNIDNEKLLKNCYFMDIPGLNENKANYIEYIFSIITKNDILFEIMVFDSTSIGSDNILIIFQKLNEKNCLLKEGNLYILNKIDKCTADGESMIDNFKNYFYQTFEDEKNNNNSKIEINFSKNHFVPMNSLLYQAESKFNEDFYSFLLIELFLFLESQNKDYTSFIDYIEKRLECIIAQNEIEEDKLEFEDNDDKDTKIIKESIDKLNQLPGKIRVPTEITIGIKLEKKKQKSIVTKLYMIHKMKLYTNYIYSESFIELQNIMRNFNMERIDLNCPPGISAPIIQKEEEEKEDLILKEMNIFLKEKLKNQFKELDKYLRVLSENLLGRKIRISFIGNISVGKSTVLNSIIGEDLLPTSDAECTYRGIIIKHKNIDEFLLFRTKLKVIGDGGYNEYYNFEEEKEPYCVGKTNILSHLKNKNNDKNMADEDAFLVIQGKLKIFDFIQIDEKLIEKIEFVDLPGHDRKNNKFNQKEYYNKILQFTNSCIYINESKSIDDELSVKRIQSQFLGDKQKLHILLQPKFILSCLFLVNKCDELSSKKEKRKQEEEKIKQSITNTIRDIEKNGSENINIAFFSGKSFIEFLKFYKLYIDILENNPGLIIKHLYENYSKAFFVKSFKDYVEKEGDKIEEKLKIELDDIEAPSNFKDKLKSVFNNLFKKNTISNKDQDKIINTLYSFNYGLKNIDFKDKDYSLSFFEKLKEIVYISDNIQNDNLKHSIIAFFETADKLFEREVEKETEIEKKKNEERYDLLMNKIIPDSKRLLEEKEEKIKNIIKNGRDNTLKIIKDEIDNAEERIKDADGDLKIAASRLEEKIKNEVKEIKESQDAEVETIIEEIIKLSDENINSQYVGKDLSLSDIEAEKGKTKQIVISIVSSALGGIAAGAGALFIGSTVAAGLASGTIGATALTTSVGALFGPLGIVAGLGVSAIIGTLSFFVYKFRKASKYKEALSENKNDLVNKFDDMESAFTKDFNNFKNSLINELERLAEVIYGKINGDEIIKQWDEIRKEYGVIKEKTKNKINNQLNNHIK